jgi:hypothetical protein
VKYRKFKKDLKFSCPPVIPKNTSLPTPTPPLAVIVHIQCNTLFMKALRTILDAPWYVLNIVIRRDLQISTVKEEIRHYSSQYSARISAHPNGLVVNLMELPDNRQLQRHQPNNAQKIPSVILVFIILLFEV